MLKPKVIVLLLLSLLLIIQFVRPKRNEGEHNTLNSFVRVYNVPDSIQDILKTSCFDCHSNRTRYPWYTNLQPIGWFLAHHINEGKDELNFGEFGSYSKRKQKGKGKSMYNQVMDSKMPPSSYTLMHRKAVLNKHQKMLLLQFLKLTTDSLNVAGN